MTTTETCSAAGRIRGAILAGARCGVVVIGFLPGAAHPGPGPKVGEYKPVRQLTQGEVARHRAGAGVRFPRVRLPQLTASNPSAGGRANDAANGAQPEMSHSQPGDTTAHRRPNEAVC